MRERIQRHFEGSYLLRPDRLNFGMPGGRQVFRAFCIGKPATLNSWGNSYQDEIGLIAVTFLEVACYPPCHRRRRAKPLRRPLQRLRGHT